MPEQAITAPEAQTERQIFTRRKNWLQRLAVELAVLLLVLMALAVGGLILLDTAPGHRFIVDRLAQVETASGLRIRVARIEGSIFGESKLKGVSVSDPQGVFLTGPEQADTLIDDDAQVNQQITLWVRHGSEVVRGHTLLLPVGGDVLYIEPLWIVSLQNQLPQVKLVSVVYRNRTAMGTTLASALRQLAVPEAEEQRLNELPWFEEAQAKGR